MRGQRSLGQILASIGSNLWINIKGDLRELLGNIREMIHKRK